jgi:LemA protein
LKKSKFHVSAPIRGRFFIEKAFHVYIIKISRTQRRFNMWTTIAVIAVILLYFIAVYNGLIARRNQVREAWATVDTQLKRRYDLIPNLIETVRGAAKHEKETLAELTRARNLAMGQGGVASADAQNKISQTLKSLFAVAENYPELKANQNFLELQRELADTETKIQATRQFYNSVVMGLNTQIEQFPSNLVANMFNIQPEKMFEIDETEKVAPQVKF